MVTGLGLAHEFGVCEPCGIDYSWLIHNPSVLLWADKIIIPKESFNEQLKTDDSKLNKAINLVLNIANENNLIETLDIKKLYENEMFSFDEIIRSDSRKLKEFYPNNIHDGNPSVPGEIIIDGDAFCYAKIAAINASLILAEETNSNLSIQSSKNAVFSRLFAYLMFKPYVFSLVFALMSQNKGNFFILHRLLYPSALRNYASLPL